MAHFTLDGDVYGDDDLYYGAAGGDEAHAVLGVPVVMRSRSIAHCAIAALGNSL